ncbi:flagellar hook-associated protein FlgL [Bacillus thermotolerans]|uniref:Flagellar hook-associated protein FlgL n=1 Tax=Bacillus thermotolerans TaxID=1221996 RepID=A0A0F5I6I5_BACTR|nr:flagellar hook-associated protein FlgL [Bacillus thermotolerans]KKB41131.1 Flagellar hook-associated protein FlgL [Bacillus thermotolerans]KKB42994.1 Flagellar hook-associated protein FlgL [Bacillus thermotolerans]
MRVTQSMLSSSMMKHLSNSYDRLGKMQDQMSSQKKVTRPSDDPVVAMKGMTYRRNLMEVEQYKRNFSEAYNWAENSDAALDQATSALQRVRELTVQASNGTYESDQRQAIAKEVKQLKEHLVQIANTKFGDKYLFNGTDTLNAPVTESGQLTSDPPNGNPVKLELSKGVYVQVNADPTKVFSAGLFEGLDNLIGTLNGEETGKEIGDFLGDLDGFIKSITNERASMGARLNRIELMEQRVMEQEIIATKVMSENEDVDMEKLIIEMTTQESVHRAALSVGARIIQPTLMDFLR